MNNQKTATSSSVISNLVDSKTRHHLHLVTNQKAPEIKGKSQEKPSDDLSVGDWVRNGSSRPGEIVEIVELKAGYPKVWVKWSGDNQATPEDPETLTVIEPDSLGNQSKVTCLPDEEKLEQKGGGTEEAIWNYLEQQSDFTPEIVIATELNITVPVARQNLRELGERVEDDEQGNWRCVQSSVAEVVVEECLHSWEFVPSPALLGFAERCSHCNEVRSIEGSDKLEELIAWLSDQVEEFKQLSDKEVDERKQAYYQNCARNKQQLIKQVNRHLAKAREEEKGELLVNSSVTSELEKEESTPDEEKDRQEAIALKAEILKLISQFFVTLGEKLKIYQEKRLYRFEAKTFGEWCEQEIGIKRDYAYKTIRAYEIYTCIQKERYTNGIQNPKIPLPTNERQLRPLSKLPQEQWFPTWVEASEQNENKSKPPSGKLVERIVKEKQRMEKQSRYQTQVDRFKVGEIVRLTAKYNQDLKEYHNCWGQVLSVEEHSYTIKAWKGEIKSVAHDDLMLLPRESKDVAENLLSKLHRSYQLHPHDPDFVAFLQYLGTKPIPEASELATKFLDFVDGERI